jgi:putative peptidoglycan lipid II flippase
MKLRNNLEAASSVFHIRDTFGSQSMRGATAILVSASLLGKLVGFIREVSIAAHFGTHADYDIFLVAITIPTLIYAVTKYTLPNAFIPVFSKLKIDSGEKKAWSFFWAFLNVNVVTFFLLSILILLFSSELLKIIAPGLNLHQLKVATALLRVAVIIVIFGGIETVLRGLLNSYKHFVYPAFAPVFYNLTIILFVIHLSGRMGTRALLWGTVSGILLQMMVVSFAFLKRKVKFPFSPRISEEGIRQIARVLFLILAIESCGQLFVLVDRFFASSLPAGSISALNYANLLFQVPLSVFALALSTAIFPYLTEEAAKRNWSNVADIFSKSLRKIIFLTIPITFFLLLFPKQVVTIIYQRGAFDSHSTLMTSKVLVFYALGLLFFSGYALILKIFYSLNFVKTLVVANLLSFSIKVISSLVLVSFLSFEVLALTTTLSGIFLFSFLLVILKNRLSSFNIKGVFRFSLKTIFISLISFGAGKGLSFFLNLEARVCTGRGMLLLKLSLISTIILIVFLTCSFWMKMEEPKRLKDICVSCYNKLT